MVTWRLVYTKQAQKDAKKIAASNLRNRTQELLDIVGLCRRFGHLRLLINGLPELSSSKALFHKVYGFLGTTLAGSPGLDMLNSSTMT